MENGSSIFIVEVKKFRFELFPRIEIKKVEINSSGPEDQMMHEKKF
jgi:hypothetical protein